MSQGLVGTFLSSSSPMFNYAPTVNASLGSSSLGWQVNGSNDALTYFTTSSSASVALQFSGTEISLSGTANRPFTVSLDNKNASQPAPVGGVLYSTSGLPQSNHTIVLYAEENDDTDAPIVFSGATITAAYNISQVPPTSSTTSYTPDNEALVYNGTWTTSTGGRQQTSAPGSTVSLNFTGFSVMVNGPIGLDGTRGIYLVVRWMRQGILNTFA
ncbi:hypothetical protein CERSUDRAFT_86009 [Gelatoporia subvermispora B]|uniref:Uncharacterized protein n=1 Tax=Ceriporiopsis subvermispora (strain B) TaxID=914234 RepID=M2QR03_CERS8|nr:hypothetical protein CERSUDRAFT_86009 [Gelatoporia subvermispora B]